MNDEEPEKPGDDEAILAATYLDMWEKIASAHALKGPPLGSAAPTNDD